jgi:TPR repeat protein
VTLALFLPTFLIAQDRAALDNIFPRANALAETDPDGANRLYEQAAGQGHALSQVMLGYRLIYGTGQLQDLPRAFSLFTAATKAGSLDGQFLLAMCYLEGLSTTKNPTAARDDLLEPADKGNQYAQFTLGIMMQNGEGGGSSCCSAAPARPVPFYPSNPSRSVNGDLTDSRLGWN